ncbi:glycerol-3-phosphate 1-O-acyltransferase PlsY [Lentisphaerota bacterium ZTH]|nr:glycerol-3-phosphate 1-O-acyltransferase PlsY [Lentisphaerota bacterium]WET05972.1 glycerol-3-phosphate 1-O-acyltransferase PlsY [Lentisphaerota bacterium ZTH]
MTTSVIIYFVAVFLGAYLIGALPWAYLIGRWKGIDLREYGSGNYGATNVTRVIGKWHGRLCFILDFLKGFVPVFAVSMMIKYGWFDDKYQLSQIVAAFGAVIGHIFPVYTRFRGGKGMSTSAGAILGLAPYSVLIAAAVWVVVFLASRYVSLASIAAAAVLPVCATFISMMKLYVHSYYVLGFLYLLALLAIVKHSSNIKRLMNGTESRFEKDSEDEASEAQAETTGSTPEQNGEVGAEKEDMEQK